MISTDIIVTFPILAEEEKQIEILDKCKLNQVYYFRLNISKVMNRLDKVHEVISFIRKHSPNAKIIMDLPYPGYCPRINKPKCKEQCVQGDEITVYTNQINNEDICINITSLKDYFTVGKIYLYDDGKGLLEAKEVSDTYVKFIVKNDFVFLSGKSIITDIIVNNEELDILNDLIIKDKPDILWLSFAENIEKINELCKRISDKIEVYLKIESKIGVAMVDAFLECGYNLVLARGDLGLTVDLVDFFDIQESVIKKCKNANKKIVIATDILSSMKHSSIPSRCELVDVSYILKKNVSGIMLNVSVLYGEYFSSIISLIKKIYKRGIIDTAK